MKDPLIFWFNNPPKVGKGAFNYVTNYWVGKVYYVFLNDFRQERKQANWDYGDFGKAKIVTLYDKQEKLEEVAGLIRNNPRAIHIVNGFESPISKLIFPFLVEKKNEKRTIFMTERPVSMGGVIERIFREIYFNIKYRNIFKKQKDITAGVLALGQLGVSVFKKYGWESEKLFPFMYCPPLKLLSRKDLNFQKNGLVKFLYVGRFYYKTKGTDILLKAAKKLKGNFLIDFVGGYGKNAKEVIASIENSNNLNYLGTWPASEVGEKMQDYDAVVVPTRYDGWNLLVNEAVNAQVPVIVTDGAVSDEIVSLFNCGIVVKHSSVEALRNAMQSVIDNPSLLLKFQENATIAKNKINESVVGKYLIDIIDYSINNSGVRPKCPWH